MNKLPYKSIYWSNLWIIFTDSSVDSFCSQLPLSTLLLQFNICLLTLSPGLPLTSLSSLFSCEHHTFTSSPYVHWHVLFLHLNNTVLQCHHTCTEQQESTRHAPSCELWDKYTLKGFWFLRVGKRRQKGNMKVLQQTSSPAIQKMDAAQARMCQLSSAAPQPAWMAQGMGDLLRSRDYPSIWTPGVWELSAEPADNSSIWCGSSVGCELTVPFLCSWRAAVGKVILSGLNTDTHLGRTWSVFPIVCLRDFVLFWTSSGACVAFMPEGPPSFTKHMSERRVTKLTEKVVLSEEKGLDHN